MYKFVKASVLLLVVSSLILYTQQQKQDPEFQATFNKYRDECIQEIGIDAGFVASAMKEKQFPNDEKLKCFFKCIHMKLGVLTESGEVLDDKLHDVSAHFHDKDTHEEIVLECKDIQGADLCETGFKLMTCIKNATLD